MAFNVNQATTYISIKLTDAGRRALSLGKLSFSKAVVSDREVDYSIDRTGYFNITSNRVLAPIDYYPNIESVNLDGSPAYVLNNGKVVSAKQFLTADTPSLGFFSGSPNNWTILTTGVAKGTRLVSYNQTWDGNTITFDAGSYTPLVGDLFMIPWITPEAAGNWQTPLIDSGTPANCLWYRVSAITSNTVTVDRPIPNFGAFSSGSLKSTAYFYPYNGIQTYYSSASTQTPICWNLNIARTYDVAGTNETTTDISGYTRYGSIEYAGARRYFGFSSETPAVGFVHYTNKFTGNTFAEQLIEKSVQMFLPTIMWHNIGESNGAAIKWGAAFYDIYGTTKYDEFAKTTYRELRDGVSSTNKIVGRVYHKIKMIVITDQELLTALSYKSNRSYTMPELEVSMVPYPKYPLSTSQATGLCKKDYNYFVTYIASSSAYTSSSSFGYPAGQHCGYISKIRGEVDINGNPQYLQIKFPTNSFPYLRSSGGTTQYKTGWNSNDLQILVSEQPVSSGYDIASVPPMSFKPISSIAVGGNGVYRARDTGDLTIDPLRINGHTFVISQQDYNTGSTTFYTLNTGLTSSQDTLNFGNESFFYGVIDCQVFLTNYKSIITVDVTNSQLNTSINPTWDYTLDSNTFITEVAVLDDNGIVVAAGKPTYPIRKNNSRYIIFQLEIDY